MDDSTLVSLEAALAASPDNLPLRLVLLETSLQRGDVQRGLRLLDALAPVGNLPDPIRLVAARLCLVAEQFDRVLISVGRRPNSRREAERQQYGRAYNALRECAVMTNLLWEASRR